MVVMEHLTKDLVVEIIQVLVMQVGQIMVLVVVEQEDLVETLI
jgi:hypothetical protein